MVMRDQGPNNSLGFGSTQRNLPINQETEAGDPTAGIFAQAVEGNTIGKFLAAAGATIVGATLAGAVVRGAGLRGMRHMALQARNNPGTLWDKSLKSYRDIQGMLDELQGIHRIKGEATEIRGGKVVRWDDPTLDKAEELKGFYFTQGEKAKMRATGGETPAEWAMRDELQQRMVRAARRLPYELPAAYVTQRAISDRLLGTGPEEPVNWTNPADVIGDFAQQSIKNVAFAFLPFEGAVGATKHGWRQALTIDPSDAANLTGVKRGMRNAVVDLSTSLNLVGHSASDLMSQTVQYGRRATGSMSTAITDSALKQRPLSDHYHQIRKGGLKSWVERVQSGEEVFSPVAQVREVVRRTREEWGKSEHLTSVHNSVFRSSGYTNLEQLAAGTLRLQGRDSFRQGEFYSEFARNAYSRMVATNLAAKGVSQDIADEFTQLTRFVTPQRVGQQTHLSKRIGFGKGPVFEGGENWKQALAGRIEPRFRGQGKSIADNIEDAMMMADKQFIGARPHMDQQIANAWSKSFRNIIAKDGQQVLGTRRAAYADFGDHMTTESSEFLVRRSAERMGVATHTSMGVRRSTSELRRELSGYGIDPSDKYQMRSFLVSKGDISKPWNPFGQNIFGLRALSVQEGMDRGVFGEEGPLFDQINRLTKAMRDTDWDTGLLDRLKVGGLYTTSQGRIIDTTPITRSARSVLDKLANEVQIPLINVNPLEMLGYGIKQGIDQQSVMRFSVGARQPFLSQADQMADAHFWLRTGRAKGRVSTLSVGDEITTGTVQGMYRPLPTDAGLGGRSVRQAGSDDAGRQPYTERTGWRRLFNMDEHQPGSVFKAFGRLRDKDDLNDVGVLLRRLQAKGDGWRGTQLPDDPAAIAGGMHKLFEHFRNSSFSYHVMRHAKPGSELEKLFKFRPPGAKADVAIRDLDGKQLQAHMRSLMEESPESLKLVDRSLNNTLNSAKSRLLDPWTKIENPAVFDQPLSKAARSSGKHRKLDDAKLDLMRYLSIRRGMRHGADEFDGVVHSLVREVDELAEQGLVGVREAAEARASIASMHTTFSRLRVASPSKSQQEEILEIADRLRRSQPGVGIEGDLHRIMVETSEYGTAGRLTAAMRRRFGASRYEYEGVEYNPFASDFALTPTFGTAFQRSPLRALSSAFGFTTWSDPEAFSTAGIIPSHLFDRMNRAVGVFNLSVDSSQFKGPQDMFLRGMIGQRALPLMAGGAGFMAVDRTAGAYVLGDRDADGDRIYRPLVLGVAGEGLMEAQVAYAGITPWGDTAAEKREELLHGEVAVRRGRWWPFGNTPFRGGQIDHYQPSWYRRLQSGWQYTDQHFGTPLERLMYGHDFSPLRPLDPYRYEDKHYYERPYPVSGDYFTGPWGPATGALNMTIGKVLKPRRMMHEEAMQQGLSRFQPMGMYGMAPPTTNYPVPGEPTVAQAIYGGAILPQDQTGEAGMPAYLSGSRAATQDVFSVSGRDRARGAAPAYLSGSRAATQDVYAISAHDRAIALGHPSTAASDFPFATVQHSASPRRPTGTVIASAPLSPGGFEYQLTETAYQMQEYAGIYGFAFGSVREHLGFGDMEYERQRPILASASQAYGVGRQFWDMNLGGLGDFPLEGNFQNIEVSELVRRFVPQPRRQNYINPIPNLMGQEHPWLPGADYFTNFHTGDPYVEVTQGEMRLPGKGYERLHGLRSDETGRYGRLDRLKILGDVAPHSNEFRQAVAEVASANLSASEQSEYETIMEQVESRKNRYEFTPYEHKDKFLLDPRRMVESFRHQDTYLHTKLIPDRTALEDWERGHVFGSSFPEWQRPIESFVKPALHKAADRSPWRAAAGLALVGHMMGATPQARAVGRMAGGVLGLGISSISHAREAITGERYMPAARKREIAIEEYSDILQYVKASRGRNLAAAAGEMGLAQQFERQMSSTMYGADIFGATPEELEAAIPKRKREHFREFLNAPERDREKILSTAGRLERRIYQAAWGLRVEKRPELEEYFEDRELPGPEWEGWDPRVGSDMVQIKMIQHQGLNASQMGYYPQQISEANLINPSYPDFGGRTENPRIALERLLHERGMVGSVREIKTPFPGVRVNVNSGF